jgi:hypothetical protein
MYISVLVSSSIVGYSVMYYLPLTVVMGLAAGGAGRPKESPVCTWMPSSMNSMQSSEKGTRDS